MAKYSRVSPTGWVQGDDANTISRVSPTGWEQVAGTTTDPILTTIPRNIHIKVMTFEFMIPEVGEEPPVGQKTIYNFLIMI